MNPVFEVRDVVFGYPGADVCVDGLSFTVAAGERVALLGANGTGKSSLLHLLDGLYFPTAGSLLAFSEPLTEHALEKTAFGPRFRQQVGFLFQDSDAQLFCPTVEDELAFGPLQLQLPEAEVRQRITDVLNLLEIPHLRERVPHRLSGGEKKRVALAALLTLNPSVLLLDEPTAGLDPRSQSMLIDLLEMLHARGLTLITATHDLTLLPHIADRGIVLNDAHRLAADMPTPELLAAEPLLLDVNLIHAHSHHHGRLVHRHPHNHIQAHDHAHGDAHEHGHEHGTDGHRHA